MAEEYSQGWSEGRKREVDRLLREEIWLLKEEIKLLRQLLEQIAPKYRPTIGISVTAGPLLVPVRR